MPKQSSPPSQRPASSFIPETLLDGLPIPKLFAFDLDYTLWPFWVDTHVFPPFKQVIQSDGTSLVQDRSGDHWCFYGHVPTILSSLHAHPSEPKIVAVSRTHEPGFAREFLRKLLVLHPNPTYGGHLKSGKDLAELASGKAIPTPKPTPANNLFHHMEIYPGSKLTHFKNIHKKFNGAAKSRKKELKNSCETYGEEVIGYEDMLFFDDERRNREVERELGVMMILVPDGITASVINDGIIAWRKKRGIIKTEVESEGHTNEDDHDPDAAWYSD